MKIKILALSLILVVVLSGCAQQTPESTEIQSDVYTVVAQTLTAMYTPVTDTPTPVPATATPTVTPTLETTPAGSTTPENPQNAGATTPMTTQAVVTTPAATSAGSTSGLKCDDAKFVNDVTIPDNTVLSPGQLFVKTWAIKNTGSCNWSTYYQLKFYSGDKMNGHNFQLTSMVYSGDTTTFSIQMYAPDALGTYTGTWSMMNDKQGYFGDFVTVKIIVQ